MRIIASPAYMCGPYIGSEPVFGYETAQGFLVLVDDQGGETSQIVSTDGFVVGACSEQSSRRVLAAAIRCGVLPWLTQAVANG